MSLMKLYIQLYDEENSMKTNEPDWKQIAKELVKAIEYFKINHPKMSYDGGYPQHMGSFQPCMKALKKYYDCINRTGILYDE